MSEDNVFDNGEPITAKPVAQKATTRKTRSKRSGKAAPQPAPKTPEIPELGVYKLHEDVQDPHLATEQAACFDMRAFLLEGSEVTVFTTDNQKVTRMVKPYPSELGGECGFPLAPGERALIPTGIIFDIPEGYSVRAHPRSGLSLKNALTLINGEGVIDSDYILEGFLPVVNHSGVRQFIKHNERCAQVEMVENLKYQLKTITTKPSQKTSRTGGFGSTGKQ